MTRIVAIIQARLGSTRLPRKVLADIAGKPMLLCIAERLRWSRHIDEVAISTTTESIDDELCEFAEKAGLRCHRGPVDDIARRLHVAATASDATLIARVWGDCPLLDPEVVDKVVGRAMTEGLDYATNVMRGELSFPDGQDVEVYRGELLANLLEDTADAGMREFPMEYVIANRERLKIANIAYHEDLSDWHISVDYAEDLEAVRAIYRSLAEHHLGHGIEALVGLLKREPALLAAFSGAPRNIEYQAYLRGREAQSA